MNRNTWIILAAFAGVVALQYMSFRTVSSELAVLRAEIRGSQTLDPSTAAAPRPIASQANPTAGLQARLANLERTVADLAKASEVLMERGIMPPSEDRLVQMQQRFLDPAASDQDRIRAFRLLRRNNQINDETLSQAVQWLQSATNGNTRRELLSQFDGITNATLKQPLLAMLQTETAGNVREELTDVLAQFASDPAVENKLWELAMNDPNGDVREEPRKPSPKAR